VVQVTAQLEGLAEPGTVVLYVLELPDEACDGRSDDGSRLADAVSILDPSPPRAMPVSCWLGATRSRLRSTNCPPWEGSILSPLGVAAVIVTRCARRAELHMPGRAPVCVDAFRSAVVDMTGAGEMP
jgi:hypothetical protein